jgi:hypothetical protein
MKGLKKGAWLTLTEDGPGPICCCCPDAMSHVLFLLSEAREIEFSTKMKMVAFKDGRRTDFNNSERLEVLVADVVVDSAQLHLLLLLLGRRLLQPRTRNHGP